MARSLTVKELIEAGMTKEMAEQAVKIQNTPKPKEVYWRFKGTKKEATKVAKENPNLTVEKQFQGSDK